MTVVVDAFTEVSFGAGDFISERLADTVSISLMLACEGNKVTEAVGARVASREMNSMSCVGNPTKTVELLVYGPDFPSSLML